MTNSIILNGPAGSGKSYIAETIVSFLGASRVLKIPNAGAKTITSIIRQVNKAEHNVIILDECEELKYIMELDSSIRYCIEKFDMPIKAIIYLTQDTLFRSAEKFKVINCNCKS